PPWWSASVAADLDGDGDLEMVLVYADEHHLFVFDTNGKVLYQQPRSSTTALEYPVVADVDNDGHAEIVVVSNDAPNTPHSPTVQVFRDKRDRWIPARRIWNQHTYHVTNVDENGHIPQFEKPHWKALNTFRTNAQVEAAGVCNREHFADTREGRMR
ncbi:MAG TPA: VCBS repeat-containing protein, partial [Polyangiaceae bacterium]